MARQRSSYKVMQYHWHFPPKLAWITDEMHPHGVLADVTPAPGRTYTRDTWPPRGRGRGESLTSPRRIEAKLRVPLILDMRRAGYTWEAIAYHLGFKDKSGPWRAVRRAYDKIDEYRFRKKEAR